MKQNCKKTFIHKNNYYLATQKGGKFTKKGSTRGKYDFLGGGGDGTRLSIGYNSKKSDKKERKEIRKFEKFEK